MCIYIYMRMCLVLLRCKSKSTTRAGSATFVFSVCAQCSLFLRFCFWQPLGHPPKLCFPPKNWGISCTLNHEPQKPKPQILNPKALSNLACRMSAEAPLAEAEAPPAPDEDAAGDTSEGQVCKEPKGPRSSMGI